MQCLSFFFVATTFNHIKTRSVYCTLTMARPTHCLARCLRLRTWLLFTVSTIPFCGTTLLDCSVIKLGIIALCETQTLPIPKAHGTGLSVNPFPRTMMDCKCMEWQILFTEDALCLPVAAFPHFFYLPLLVPEHLLKHVWHFFPQLGGLERYLYNTEDCSLIVSKGECSSSCLPLACNFPRCCIF